MGQRQTKAPQDIVEFRKLVDRPDHFDIPESPQKRHVTDLKCTIVLAVCLVLSLIFLTYTLCYSDIRRFSHGYDNCGNVCGYQNKKYDGISCSGQNMESYPYLTFKEADVDDGMTEPRKELIADVCVVKCPSDTVELLGRCFPTGQSKGGDEEDFEEGLSKFGLELGQTLEKTAGTIVALCFIGLLANFGMLALFRFIPAFVVWVILGGGVSVLLAFTIFLWYKDATFDDVPGEHRFRILAIIFTVLTVAIVILLVFLFKRIKLVIRLFKEAMKTIFDIPLILAEPLLTILANSILFALFIFLTWLMSTSGTLEAASKYVGLYEYQPNGAMLFTIWFNAVMTLWMSQFIIGCQYMVVSGAVSAHYFCRDKSTLTSPIYNSFYNLVRFHLGTVAFGSLIITIITLVKALIKSLCENRYAKIFVDCCLGVIEDFLRYLSKNAYIQTAIHGQEFFESGKRAVRLLVANALSAVAVNFIGDFIMFMAKLLIILFTVLVGFALYDTEVKYFWFGIIIAAVVTALISQCFFSVFEITIDTLFLCSCEDMSLNDGIARPYYMTTDFMQYIEDAKVATKKK